MLMKNVINNNLQIFDITDIKINNESIIDLKCNNRANLGCDKNINVNNIEQNSNDNIRWNMINSKNEARCEADNYLCLLLYLLDQNNNIDKIKNMVINNGIDQNLKYFCIGQNLDKFRQAYQIKLNWLEDMINIGLFRDVDIFQAILFGSILE